MGALLSAPSDDSILGGGAVRNHALEKGDLHSRGSRVLVRLSDTVPHISHAHGHTAFTGGRLDQTI